MGYKVIAFGAHPSTTSGHNDDPQNCVFGDCLTRNRIAIEYNKSLQEQSKNNGLFFVSIFDYLVDDNFMTKMEYFKDYCHLDGGKIKEFLKIEFKKIGIDSDSEINIPGLL
jgi:hypothetical protein